MYSMFAGTTQCVVAVGVRGPFDEERFRASVDEVQGRHQILQCTIAEYGGDLWFAPAPCACSRLEVVRDVDWRDLFQTLNSTPLALDESPWSIKVVCSSGAPDAWEVLVTLHHSLMDGHGVDVLIREILVRYAGRLRTCTSPPARLFRPLPPPAEAMLPRTLSWDDFQAHQRRLAAKPSGFAPELHKGSAPLHARCTRTLFLTVDASAVESLGRMVVEQSTTLNSWIATCLLHAVEACSPGRSSLMLGTAFSLRGLCDALGADDLGCHIAVISTLHESDVRMPLPERAREHGRMLTRAVLAGARHPSAVDYGALRRSMEPLHEIRAFVGDVGYTYIDSALDRDMSPLVIEHFYGSASRALGAATVVLHAVRQAGALFFTMNYTTPLQSGAWIEDVTGVFEHVLAGRGG